MSPPPPPVICVGSAPSSGSTLLADLLDSVPGTGCGPELNIFCIDDAYRFDRTFKKAARARRSFRVRSSLIARSRFFNTRHLAAVGLDSEGLDQLIADAKGLPDFVAAFVDRFAAFRRRTLTVFVEKSPQNIAYAAQFLGAFPDGLFVHVIRDGRAVVGSLKRRGYCLHEGAMIWLWESAVGREAATRFSRVRETKYEDLARDPFGTVSRLVTELGVQVDPGTIEASFAQNPYRAALDRVETWRENRFSGRIVPDLGFDADLGPGEVAFLEALTLHRPDRTAVSFAEMLGHYGYPLAGSGRQVGIDALTRYAVEYLAHTKNLAIQKGHLLLLSGMAQDRGLDSWRQWFESLAQEVPR